MTGLQAKMWFYVHETRFFHSCCVVVGSGLAWLGFLSLSWMSVDEYLSNFFREGLFKDGVL